MTMTISSRRALLLCLVILLVPAFLRAQQQDFGTWWELELEKELKGNIDLGLELEQRFRENSTRYDRSLATLTAGGALGRFLDLGGGLRFLAVKDNENGIEARYRLHLDATGRYNLSFANLRLRARFQYGFEEFVYFGDMNSNILVNRIRLKASHAFFGTPWTAFASAETWGLFGNLDGRYLKRMRYTAGLRYRLNMRSGLQLRIIVEDEFHQVRPDDSLILVVGYSRML